MLLFPVSVGPYHFRVVQTASEMEAVHRLNYRTFVNEIPQHPSIPGGILVDKFHDKNLYFGAFRENELVGMVSVHSRPPFSISNRLEDPSLLESLADRPLEVRLLAVLPSERYGIVFAGLGWQVYRFAKGRKYTHLLISGLLQRKSLYHRLGFHPVGKPVGKDNAQFIPMVLNLDEVPSSILMDINRWEAWIERIGTDYGLSHF